MLGNSAECKLLQNLNPDIAVSS